MSGVCIFLGGNLIGWSARKEKVVAKSSTEVEYRALSSAATDLVWIQNILTEIGVNLSQTPVLWSDNLRAQALACNHVYHSRTKHIEIYVHFIQNLVSHHKLEVRYVPTESQPADLLTKALPMERFRMLCHKLTMNESMLSLRGLVDAYAPHVNFSEMSSASAKQSQPAFESLMYLICSRTFLLCINKLCFMQ